MKYLRLLTITLLIILSNQEILANCNASFTFNSRGLVNTFFSNAPGKVLKWTFGDGDTSDRTSPIHIYDTLGTYTVCLYVYDSTSRGLVLCDSSCQTITLGGSNNTCSASFTYQSRGLVNTFISNSSGTNGRRVRWTFGDGDTSDKISPIHIYDTLGTYTVCLYVYDSTSRGWNLCDSSCQTITVGSGSGGGRNCSASFNYSIDSLNNQKIIFNNTSTGSIYVWKFGDGTTDSTVNPSHTYTNGGRYIACLYVYDSTSNGLTLCDSTCKTIVISSSSAQCKASFYIGLDTTNKYNIYIVNNSTGTNSTTSYIWTFGDGDSSTQKNPTHQYDTFGAYNLCLTITTRSTFGTCTSTHCDTVGMDSNGMLLKNGAFGITIIDESDLLSVNELSYINNVNTYPNPTSGEFKIEVNSKVNAEMNVNIINALGQQVFATNTNATVGNNTLDVNLTQYQQGIYYVRVQIGNAVKVQRLALSK